MSCKNSYSSLLQIKSDPALRSSVNICFSDSMDCLTMILPPPLSIVCAVESKCRICCLRLLRDSLLRLGRMTGNLCDNLHSFGGLVVLGQV